VDHNNALSFIVYFADLIQTNTISDFLGIIAMKSSSVFIVM